ncbi:S8 family serine peptidase [Photobacterium sp. 2_MG-2023]|uniref:S8 family serine peptidase n=1 Tax=Photobacterium sp. 2_MG-2023 TaxID=3062663 RepID=UPI0026E219CF|nr:S8 family serine peptidase [Photobacterium sp. 2_MG-2023]MDO6581167.1 S8 family serine peptidase [Photobacterium sp. 2_MG-2023]
MKLMFYVIALTFTALAQTQVWPESLTLRVQEKNVQFRFLPQATGAPVYIHPWLGTKALQVGTRVLVKHEKALKLANLRHHLIVSSAVVFELEAYYWSVMETQSPLASLALVQQLQSLPGIVMAEPDLLQIRLGTQGGETGRLPMPPPKPVRQQLSIEQWPATPGAEVTLAVIDSAFGLADPALQPFLPKLHYDIDQRRPLPLEPSEIAVNGYDSFHGDATLATLWSRHPDTQGLAFAADAVLLRRDTNWTSDILVALQLAYLSQADLILAAWTLPLTQQALSDALTFVAENGRQGKGTLLIAAAGNFRENLNQSFSLAAQPQVLTVNAESQGTVWPVIGEPIATQVPVPYLTFSQETGRYSLTFSNTSAAATAVAGVLAAVLGEQPALTAADLHRLVRQYSQPVFDAQGLMQHFQRAAQH